MSHPGSATFRAAIAVSDPFRLAKPLSVANQLVSTASKGRRSTRYPAGSRTIDGEMVNARQGALNGYVATTHTPNHTNARSASPRPTRCALPGSPPPTQCGHLEQMGAAMTLERATPPGEDVVCSQRVGAYRARRTTPIAAVWRRRGQPESNGTHFLRKSVPGNCT